MHINKAGKSDSIDLFFEIMSKFNDRDNPVSIEKTASVETEIAQTALGRLSRLVHIGKGGAKALPSLSKAVDDALKVAAKKGNPEVHGIWRLLKGSTSATRAANWVTIKNNLSLALRTMTKEGKASADDLLVYITREGELTDAAVQMLKTAARKEGTTSAKAADEIVDQILNGNIFLRGKSGPVQRELYRASKAAKAAKKTRPKADAPGATPKADAPGATPKADAPGATPKADAPTPPNPKLTPEDAAKAVSGTSSEHIKQINKILKDVDAHRVVGGTAEEVAKHAAKKIDEALEIAAKIKPKALSDKMSHLLHEMKTSMRNSVDDAAGIRQSNEIHLSEGAKIENSTITQLNGYKSAAQLQLEAVKRAQARLRSTKSRITALNNQSAKIGDINQTVNIGGNIGGKVSGELGNDTFAAFSDIMLTHLRASTEGMQMFSNTIIKSVDELRQTQKALQKMMIEGTEAQKRIAREQLEAMGKMSKKFDELVDAQMKFMREFQQAGGKIAPEVVQRWGKFKKLVFWLGVGTMGAAAWHKWGPEGSIKDSIGDFLGTGGGGGGGGTGGQNPFAGGQGSFGPGQGSLGPYGKVTDPAARKALSQVDPSSPNYNPRNGWEASNRMIEKLKNSGRLSELNAYLDALMTQVYRKRFKIELERPFVVPGSPVPLYYAFVNQHRSPAPNLSDPTGMTLQRKGLTFQYALHDQEETTIADIFDQTNMLMRRDAQRAINYTAEETIAKGLAEKDTSRPWYHFGIGDDYYRGEQFLAGNPLDRVSDQGIGGHRGKRWSDADRALMQRRRNASEDRIDSLKKLAESSARENSERLMNLESLANMAIKTTNITKNTDNQTLQKEADDFSKSYCKDAVTDLNHTDKTLQSYFAGLGGLYDQRLEKRKADFKTLYNVTDETGEDLIYEAHPKEVVVSDSIGRGGLVENGLEQKRQTHGVALSAPTGNYRANYASRYDALKKLAN